MVSQLSAGAIQRILDGEQLPNIIVQLLGYKTVPGAGASDRYRLLISDGELVWSFVILGTQLNHMIFAGELEKFTIIQINKYVCNNVTAEKKIAILLNITVLSPGVQIGVKLGNPAIMKQDLTEAGPNDVHIKKEPVSNGNLIKKPNWTIKTHVTEQRSSCWNNSHGGGRLCSADLHGCHMVPQLTAGAVKRIINGEQLSSVIMQVLGHKKVPGSSACDRFRVLISDGEFMCSFAMLGIQLNHMIYSGDLEKFTVIQVNKYICNNVTQEKKIVILLDITVLVPGVKICIKLGNPVVINQTPTDAEPNAAPIEKETVSNRNFAEQPNRTTKTHVTNKQPISYSNHSCGDERPSSVDFRGCNMFPQLSAGAIKKVLNAELMPSMIVQILAYKRVPFPSDFERYRLLISDGDLVCSFVMLGTHLNHMISTGNLEKFTVIQVSKYICHNVIAEKKIVILLDATVLVPGNEIGVKLGNPVIINQTPTAAVPNDVLIKKKPVSSSH